MTRPEETLSFLKIRSDRINLIGHNALKDRFRGFPLCSLNGPQLQK